MLVAHATVPQASIYKALGSFVSLNIKKKCNVPEEGDNIPRICGIKFVHLQEKNKKQQNNRVVFLRPGHITTPIFNNCFYKVLFASYLAILTV